MPIFMPAKNSEQESFDRKRILFCPYCGAKLDNGARFCKHCGEPIPGNNQEPKEPKQKIPTSGNPTERKTVYEGYIHKCPNCGEVLEAFVTVCPACGYEIRDAKSSSSVQELASKLENITAEKMPTFEEKKSIMKMLFGKDFKEGNEAEEALKRFELQKSHEKASLIINFSIPNTKEDIMEFMILAATNIDIKQGVDDEVTKAWIAKLDQAYQKARISMSNHPYLAQIESIYQQKQKELKIKKLQKILLIVGGIAGWLFLLGLIANPMATLGITAGILILAIVVVILVKRM